MVVLTSIVLIIALFFSVSSIRNMVLEFVVKDDVHTMYTSGYLIIACIFWGVFYFLIH